MSDSWTSTRGAAPNGGILGRKSMKELGLSLLAMMLLTGMTAAEGLGQVMTHRSADRVVSAGAERNAEADRLERHAAALHESPARYGEGAVLYERAADLREHGDARKVNALLLASQLYYHAGRKQESVAVLDRAAEVAVATGDVVRAVSSMTDAAWVLAGEGRKAEAVTLVARARLLTHSPLLSESERHELRRRLGS